MRQVFEELHGWIDIIYFLSDVNYVRVEKAMVEGIVNS